MFFHKNYGINKFLKNTLNKRFEKNLKNKKNNLNKIYFYVFYKFFTKFILKKSSILDKYRFNIYLNYYLTLYKGYRHLFRLPVRGQRTWTNANNSYKLNTFLSKYKLMFLKKNFDNINLAQLNNALLSEEYNLMWKDQWERIWKESRYKRLQSSKEPRVYYNVDLSLIASGSVNIKEKKKKINYLIGFDPGFTKYVIKNQKKGNNFKKK